MSELYLLGAAAQDYCSTFKVLYCTLKGPHFASQMAKNLSHFFKDTVQGVTKKMTPLKSGCKNDWSF